MTSALEEGPKGLQAPAQDLRVIFSRLLAYVQDKPADPGRYLVIKPDQLTANWVATTGLQAPTLVQYDYTYREQLQDVLQQGQGTFDLSGLSKLLEGPSTQGTTTGSLVRSASSRSLARKAKVTDREVQTIDISRQAQGPKWTIRQWCLYWNDRHVEPFTDATGYFPLEGDSTQHQAGGQSRMRRQCSDVIAHISAGGSGGREAGDEEDEADSAFVHQGAVDQFIQESAPRQGILASNKRRLISLSCLPIADTTLRASLAPPETLVAVDLLRMLHQTSVASSFPFWHYLACHPASAVLNFTMNKTGATSWFHVVAGRMVVVMIPPTSFNLSVYATWADKGPRVAGLLLAEACQGVVHLQVESGQAVIVPGGWPYCLAALDDTLLLGAQMLHINNLRLQFAAWEVEELMASAKRSSRHVGFPSFKHLMWHTALHYAKVLRVATGLPKVLKARVTSSKDPLGAVPTPTFSHSQAVVMRRPPPGLRTDSTSAWAAGSMDDGDHAMSARKRHPLSLAEQDTTPEPTHDAPSGTHGPLGPSHAATWRGLDQLVAGRAAICDAASDDEAHAAASSRGLKRLRPSTAVPGVGHSTPLGSSDERDRYQARPRLELQHQAMDVDEHADEVDENVLAMQPLSPAVSAGCGRTPGKQLQLSDVEGGQQGPGDVGGEARQGLGGQPEAKTAGAGRFKLKIKAAGLGVPVVPLVQAPVQQVGGRQRGGQRGKAKGKTAGTRNLLEDDDVGDDDEDDEDWHMSMSSDSGVLTMDSEEQESPVRRKKAAKGKPSPTAAAGARGGRQQRGRAGTGRTARAQQIVARASQSKKQRKAAKGSDSDYSGLSEDEGDELSMGSDSEPEVKPRRHRAKGGDSDFDEDFGSDVQDTDPEDMGKPVGGGFGSEEGKVRRSNRRSGAHGLTAAQMEQKAMVRREQEADTWDLLRQRSARARRGSGSGAATRPAVVGGSTPLQVAVQGRRAAAAAAAWSEDDSDEPPLRVVSPPVAVRSRGVVGVAAAARPQRSVKRRTWDEEDVFDSDVPDTEPDSEEVQTTPPSSPDAASGGVKRSGGGAGRRPGNSSGTPGRAGTGIKLKVAVRRGGLGQGEVSGAAGGSVQQGAVEDMGVTGAPKTGVKLKLKRPGNAPVSMNIPQTDGAGDDDEDVDAAHQAQAAVAQEAQTVGTLPAPNALTQQAVGPLPASHATTQQAAGPLPASHATTQQAVGPSQASHSTTQQAVGAQFIKPASSDTLTEKQQLSLTAIQPAVQAATHPQQPQQAGTPHKSEPSIVLLPPPAAPAAAAGKLTPSPSQVLMPPPPARHPAAQALAASAVVHPPQAPMPSLQGPVLHPPHLIPASSHPFCSLGTGIVPGISPSTAPQGHRIGAQQPVTGSTLGHDPPVAATKDDQQVPMPAGGSAQPASEAPPAQQQRTGSGGRGAGRGGHHTAAVRVRAVKNISDKAPNAAKAQAVAPLISLGDGRSRAKAAPSLKGSRQNKLQLPGATSVPQPSGTGNWPATVAAAQPAQQLLGPSPSQDAPLTAAGTAEHPPTSSHASKPPEVPTSTAGGSPVMAVASAPAAMPNQLPARPDGHATMRLPADLPAAPAVSTAPTALQSRETIAASGPEGMRRPLLLRGDNQQPQLPHVLPAAAPDTGAAASVIDQPAAPSRLQLPASNVLAGIPSVATQLKSSAALPGAGTPLSALAPTTATAGAALPLTLSAWEVADFPILLGMLKHWQAESSVIDDLPFSLKDPAVLFEQLEEGVALYCLGAAAKAAQEAIREGLLPLRLPQPLPSTEPILRLLQGSGLLNSESGDAAADVQAPGPDLGPPVSAGALQQVPSSLADAAQHDASVATQQGSGAGSLTSAGPASSKRVPLIWPDMHPDGLLRQGLQLLRPKVGFASAQQLPSGWQAALKFGSQREVSSCPSSVIVGMDVGDQVEVVENNDEFLQVGAVPMSAARPGAGPGGNGSRGARTGQAYGAMASAGAGAVRGMGVAGQRTGAGRGAGGGSKKAAQWSKKLQQR